MRRILILDWDDVVFDRAAVINTIFSVLASMGAADALAKQTYDEIKADGRGYNPIAHARLIAKHLDKDAQPYVDVLMAQFADMRKFVFPDAQHFVEEMYANHIPLGVLTAGDPWFQVHKIATSGLQGKFAMVEVVSGQNFIEEKVERIKNFLDRFERAVMFDDRVPILERMQNAWKAKLLPIFVNRKKEAAPDSGIASISSFSDQSLSDFLS